MEGNLLIATANRKPIRVMKNHKKRNIARILVIVVGSLAVLFIAALFFGGIWAEKKIMNIMEESSVDGESYSAEKVSVSLINRSVRFDRLALRTRLTDKTGKVTRMDLLTDNVTANGIGFPKRKGTRYIDIGSLAMASPTVSVVAGEEKTTPAPSDGTVRKVNGISIGKIRLTGGKFKYETGGENGPQILEVNDLSLDATGFRLDSTRASSLRPFYCDNVKTRAEKIRYLFQKNAFLLHTGPVELDSRNGTLRVDRIALDPQYPKNEFAAKALSDWTQASVGTLSCHRIDFSGLFSSQQLVMDSAYIGEVKVISYKNRKVYQPEKNKKMIHESIQQLPLKIDIGNIRLENIDATYQELDEDGLEPGTIAFNGISGNFRNVTNVTEGNDPYMVLGATGLLMNAGRIDATFNLPVSSAHPAFTVQGTLGPMELTLLNPTLEPLLDTRVDKGKADRMEFHITGTTTSSRVNLTLLYHDLHASLLKEKDDHLVRRKFLSFLADKIFIKNENPDHRGVRYGEGTFERDFTKSQFNYLWKSLLPGLKQTIIGNNREE